MSQATLDKNNIEAAANHRLLTMVSLVAVLAAFVMAVIKIGAWHSTGSIAMLGALLDSLMDGASSLFIFFALRYSMQPADKEHRFGHGKAEAIAAFSHGLLLLSAAVFLLASAAFGLYEPTPVANAQIGIIASAICIVITLGLLALQNHAIRRTASLAIRADNLHYRGDVLLYLSVIAALLLTDFLALPSIDAMFGIGIAIYIGFEATRIISDAAAQLMDRELPDNVRDQIKEIARAHQSVHDVHDLRTRMSGQRMVIQFHVEMDGDVNLRAAHDVSDEVEEAISKTFPNADILIHQDPAGLERHSRLERS